MYWHGGMGSAGWWGLGLGMVVFWLLVIAAVAFLVRWVGAPPGHGAAPPPPVGPSSRARAILDERFARGEIDEETYRRGRDALDR